MSTFILTNAGEKTLLEWAIKSAGGAMKLKIFTNDATISPTTVAGDLTEATFSGYTERSLDRASWGAATTVDDKARMTYSVPQIYTFASDQDIWGHYITDASDNLLFVEKYDAARVQFSGDELTIVPKLIHNGVNPDALTPTTGAWVTSAGELKLMEWIFRGTGENLVLRLFKAFPGGGPDYGSVLADFTESDFVGYTSKTLTRASWNTAATVSGIAESSYNTEQSYTPGSDQDLWGWMLCTVGGELLVVQRYSAARSLVNGDEFILRPKFTLRSAV